MTRKSRSRATTCALGVVPPDFALAKTLLQMDQLRAPAPEKSTLVNRWCGGPRKSISPATGAAQAAKIVRDKLYPALDRQIALVKEMQKGASHDAGVWRLPDGEPITAPRSTSWATTDKEPAEIHQLGLDIVADHTAKLDALMKTQGLTKGSVGERLQAMFSDPRFIPADTDAAKAKLIADLNAKVRQVRACCRNGSAPCPRPMWKSGGSPRPSRPPSRWAITTALRWMANAPASTGSICATPPKRRAGRCPPLTFHEGIPGHHLQISLQQEAGLPLIRKTCVFSAYIEGWALYAEQLAVEMGMYEDDPLGEIGQLHDAMFRGVRLVVDSGMHAMKWSREKAVKLFRRQCWAIPIAR